MNMNQRDIRAFNLAIREARRFPHDSSFHLAAVLMRRSGEILSIGHNFMKRTHSKSNHPWKFLHAEVDALLGINVTDLYNSTLFVARTGFEDRKSILLAKPCKWCASYIERAFVRKCYYSIDDNTIGCWNVKNDTIELICPS